MAEAKRVRTTTIEDIIRERSYELFEYMYEPNKYDDYKLLRIACESQNYSVAYKLYENIDQEAEMDYILDPIDMILEEDEFTTLMYFAKYNWFQLIDKLKGKLSDDYINLREYQDGRTALFIAVQYGNKLATKSIIDIGANPKLGTCYEESRWSELYEEIIDGLPTYYEDMCDCKQASYYGYLEDYYNREIENGNYNVREYLVELANLDDEFFDIYATDHIISDITPAMIACKKKSLELLKLVWYQPTQNTRDSNGINILDYAKDSRNDDIIQFVTEKLIPYRVVENCEIDCSICLIVRSNIKTDCGHYFCKDCLLKWLCVKSNCPMCRKEFISFK